MSVRSLLVRSSSAIIVLQPGVFHSVVPCCLVAGLQALGLEPDTATPSLEDFVGGLAGAGFNHVLMNVFANQSTWNQDLTPLTPPRVSPTHTIPWGVDMEAGIDYTTLNTRFFAHVDRALTVLL